MAWEQALRVNLHSRRDRHAPTTGVQAAAAPPTSMTRRPDTRSRSGPCHHSTPRTYRDRILDAVAVVAVRSCFERTWLPVEWRFVPAERAQTSTREDDIAEQPSRIEPE